MCLFRYILCDTEWVLALCHTSESRGRYEAFCAVVIQVGKVVVVTRRASARQAEALGRIAGRDKVFVAHGIVTLCATGDGSVPITLEEHFCRSVINEGAFLAMNLGVADALITGV